MPIGFVLAFYKLVYVLTSIGGLALMVYKLVFMFTSIAHKIVPIGLALISNEFCPGFDIGSKVKPSCTWIDTGLRNPFGVGNLLHNNVWLDFNSESFKSLK